MSHEFLQMGSSVLTQPSLNLPTCRPAVMIDLIIEYTSQHLTANIHFLIANQEAQITYFVSNEMKDDSL